MAVTPRYNDGAAPLTGPVNGERISAGRGVSIDSGALMGADIPMLDASGAVAMGRGGAAIGEGLAHVGDRFLDLAEKVAVMQNTVDVNAARRIMTGAEYELAAQQEKNPNQKDWQGMADNAIGTARDTISKLQLSKAATDEVESVLSGWEVGLKGKTSLSVARKVAHDFESDHMDIYRTAINTGDTKQMEASVTALHDTGVISDARKDALLVEGQKGIEITAKRDQAKLYEAKTNQLTEWSKSTPPDELREMVKSPDFTAGLEPKDAQNLREETERLINFNKGVSLESNLNRIWTADTTEGRIKSEADIDAISDPNISDLDKKKLKHEFSMRNNVDMQEWMQKNAPYIAANLSLSIDNYKVANDEAEHNGAHVLAMNLRQQIARLPEGMKSHLSTRLYNREYPSKAKSVTGSGSVFDMGDDLLKQDFHSNGFGKSGSSNSLVMNESADANKDTPETRDARIVAKRNYSKAREEWRKWSEAHPESTTFEGDAEKEFRKIEGKYLLDGASGASVQPPSLFPTDASGAAIENVNPDVSSVLRKYDAPQADTPPPKETQAGKQSKSGVVEPPLPEKDNADSGSSLLPVDAPPPFPEYDGENLISLDEAKVKQLEDRKISNVSVFDPKSKVWRQMPLSDAKKGDYLIAP